MNHQKRKEDIKKNQPPTEPNSTTFASISVTIESCANFPFAHFCISFCNFFDSAASAFNAAFRSFSSCITDSDQSPKYWDETGTLNTRLTSFFFFFSSIKSILSSLVIFFFFPTASSVLVLLSALTCKLLFVFSRLPICSMLKFSFSGQSCSCLNVVKSLVSR